MAAAAHSLHPSRLQADPLWLVVEQDGRAAQSFEMMPETQRAVVFGAAEGVDYRMEMAPAIALFIEREGNEIWMTLAYNGDEVRIDAQRLESRRRVLRVANVELRGTRLRLRVRDTPPTLRGQSLSQEPGGGDRDRGSCGETCAESLLWANDSTPDIDRLFTALEAGNEDTPTTELTPRASHPMRAPVVTTEYSRDELMFHGIFPSVTTEMSRAELNELFDCGERSSTEPALEKSQPLDAAPGERSHDGLENSERTPALERAAILLKPEQRRQSPIERLGMLAKTRPLLVVAIATFGAIVFLLFLVGLAKLSREIGRTSEIPDQAARSNVTRHGHLGSHSELHIHSGPSSTPLTIQSVHGEVAKSLWHAPGMGVLSCLGAGKIRRNRSSFFRFEDLTRIANQWRESRSPDILRHVRRSSLRHLTSSDTSVALPSVCSPSSLPIRKLSLVRWLSRPGEESKHGPVSRKGMALPAMRDVAERREGWPGALQNARPPSSS